MGEGDILGDGEGVGGVGFMVGCCVELVEGAGVDVGSGLGVGHKASPPGGTYSRLTSYPTSPVLPIRISRRKNIASPMV